MSRDADDSVSYDGRLARAYDHGRELLPDAALEWARSIDGLLESGGTVLDVGAGTGRFAGLFAQRFNGNVVAVEPAQGMRSQGIARNDKGVAWLSGRAESLPIRDATADVVWLACVVHYLDLGAAGREFARVLRPSGKLLVRSTFPERFDDLEWIRWFPAARAIDEERMPTVARLEAAWYDAGLRLEQRRLVQHLVATSLTDLAERLSHRAISTLELIADPEFEAGMAALREEATTAPSRPIYSPVDVLVFETTRSGS